MPVGDRQRRARHATASGIRPRRREGSARSDREHVTDAQRTRILTAMVHVAGEHGVRCASVERVVKRAGVSRRTFYILYRGLDDCLLAAIEQIVHAALSRADAAYTAHDSWAGSVRGALHALLAFFDEQPALARLCVLDAPAGHAATLARRRDILDELASVVDRGRRERPAATPSPLTAESVVGGALGVIHTRLLIPDSEPLVGLLNPLMSMIVLPYLGTAAARRELSRALPTPPPAPPVEDRDAAGPLDGLEMRLTYRTLRVLSAIAEGPGLGNNRISERAGVRDQGQISKMLARLAQLGLTENTGRGQPSNSWRLTPKGEQLERTFRREIPA
jgi:AcrR family transcriptional regulator